MEKLEYKQPEYLLCELPIKDGSFNDHRIWIYHRLSLSLIEFIEVSSFADFEFNNPQDFFLYGDEEWFGVFVQDNTEATNNNRKEVLKGAWNFLHEYLQWEDKQDY